MRKKAKAPTTRHYCRECARCIPVTRFHTLSVTGQPTLGECPLREWRVLLSDPACPSFREK